MKFRLLATAAAFAASLVSAHAQQSIETNPVDVAAQPNDLPVNAPSGAVVKSLGGFYMWGQGGAWDAMQQKPAEPNAENSANSPAAQRALSPDMPLPSASSATTRGAVGYVMPSGTLSPKFGSNVRTEFGLSQTTANMPLSGGAGAGVYNGIALGGCGTCAGISGYDATEMSAKAATDYSFDALTLTPSVTVFNSDSQQNFNGSGASALGWHDTGAKVGLNGKVDLNQQVSIGVGGSYGVASRTVSLSAANGGGSESTSPYLANGEAKITYKPSDELSFNGFAGVSNYDNKLPGVSGGGKVDYSSTGNTYYGGGATWHFGTK
jgi:hypothetical protein